MAVKKKTEEKVENKVEFEAAVKRLDEIVALLERNPSSLDEAVSLYKEGKEMLGICQEKLEKAEGEILKYSADGIVAIKGGSI